MSDFPVLTLEGSPSERGLAYGRLAADRIRDGVDFYAGVFARAGLHRSRLERASARLSEEIGCFDAGMLLELEAIARGAAVTLAEIISLNARSELMRMADDGCTGIACLPRATGSGHTLLAQNWDWHPSRAATGVLLRIVPDEGPAILTFAEAGALARCGLNEHGLGVVGNAIQCENGTRPGGVPVALIRRRILGCRTLAEALHAVRETRRGTSVTHLIASTEGDAIGCEATPDEVYEVGADEGLLAHSNHFLSARAQRELVDTGVELHPDTLDRAPRMRKLLAACRPARVVDVIEALRDHDGYPDSICRHATEVDIRTWTTVASIVMDLEDRRIWLAGGQPCQSELHEHELTPAARSRSPSNGQVDPAL